MGREEENGMSGLERRVEVSAGGQWEARVRVAGERRRGGEGSDDGEEDLEWPL